MILGRVAELVDAPDSKSSSSNGVRVRFPSRPPEIMAERLFFDDLIVCLPISLSSKLILAP